jgi:Golgi nucleoside diphosphatase
MTMLKLACLVVSLAICISAQSLEYGAVIDAGSSGSRINLFSWPSRYSSDTVPPPLSVLQVGAFSDDSPGLSSYASHPEDAGKSLASLLDYVRQKAQQWGVSISTIPIYLKATAGLRVLSPSVVNAYGSI